MLQDFSQRKGKKIKHFAFIGFPLFLYEPPFFFHFLPLSLNRRLWGCRNIHMPQEKWEGELSVRQDLCFFASWKMTTIQITMIQITSSLKQNRKKNHWHHFNFFIIQLKLENRILLSALKNLFSWFQFWCASLLNNPWVRSSRGPFLLWWSIFTLYSQYKWHRYVGRNFSLL